jgi:hypothetical protein
MTTLLLELTNQSTVVPNRALEFRDSGRFKETEYEAEGFGTNRLLTKTIRVSVGVSSTEQMQADRPLSGTTAIRLDSDLERWMHRLAVEFYRFADGATSDDELWDALHAFLAQAGDAGLVELDRQNAGSPLPVVAYAAALRMLGIDPSPATPSGAKWLLARGLRSSSPSVRDGALVGLMNLDDPSAVPIIAKAAERETIESLKRHMLDALLQWAA